MRLKLRPLAWSRRQQLLTAAGVAVAAAGLAGLGAPYGNGPSDNYTQGATVVVAPAGRRAGWSFFKC